MTEHTPGPWKWHWATDANGNADGRIHTPPGFPLGIAVCIAVSPRYQTKEQWKADARLIAAAPDLLATLKALKDPMNEQEYRNALDAAQVAIDNAEGRATIETALSAAKGGEP